VITMVPVAVAVAVAIINLGRTIAPVASFVVFLNIYSIPGIVCKRDKILDHAVIFLLREYQVLGGVMIDAFSVVHKPHIQLQGPNSNNDKEDAKDTEEEVHQDSVEEAREETKIE